MVIGIVSVLGVGLIHLVVSRGKTQWRTAWLCAIGAAFVLTLPGVDTAIDGAAPTPNLTDLGHVLLAGVAWWALGHASLKLLAADIVIRTQVREALGDQAGVIGRRGWNIANATAGVLAWAMWKFGDGSRVEVDNLMTLHDTPSRVLAATYMGWAFVGGLLVVTASALSLRNRATKRAGALLMIGMGICGIGYAATAALVWTRDGGDTFAANSAAILERWAGPGLLLLALSGLLSLARQLYRRLARTA